LNVAEKNSVSKSVTEILSKKKYQTGNSLSKFNPVYKFNYEIKDVNYKMNFTSVRGHLFNYDFPKSVKLWNANKITRLFEEDPIPQIKPEDLPIKKNLQSLGK
jgi:DNA topoisomerase-3